MIHLDVIVADTATLLETEAYGAGALLRWESGAAAAGPFVEGGTVALVSGQSVYDVWDSVGTVGTWYRTRISNAGGSTFSGYSVPYQTTEQGLYLSLTQLRGFNVGGTLSDEALLILLGAAAQDIVEAAGPMNASIVETLRGWRGPLLYLARSALAITSIVEDDVTLAANDYSLDYGGQLLRRLDSGTHATTGGWGYEVVVTYQPQNDLAQRQRVQLELVKHDLTFSPGLTGQTIGTWSESYGGAPYDQERAAILGSLTSGSVLVR